MTTHLRKTLLCSMALVCTGVFVSRSFAQTLSIQGNVNGSTATLTASLPFGGAITSFNYRGMEYIYALDHGTDMQSAAFFDRDGKAQGPCFNPTEAGNIVNTPSQLLAWSNDGGTLFTHTNMAFWMPPGYPPPIPNYCGEDGQNVSTSEWSDYLFWKTVSFGVNGIPNVLNYTVHFQVPEQHNFATFEALTGYLRYQFPNGYSYDPGTATLAPVPHGAIGFNQPPKPAVFFATQDGLNAMGVYSPAPFDGYYSAISNLISESGQPVYKWNCVFDVGAISPGSIFSFQCNVPFGTVDEVVGAIRGLAGYSNGIVPIYRFYGSGDHFLTATFSEASSIGQWTCYGPYCVPMIFSNTFAFEGTAFRVHPTPLDSGMHALYRCYVPQAPDHFVSADSNCEGQVFDGVYGYVSSYPRPGYEEVDRCYAIYPHLDHLATTNPQECINAGYTVEGPLGYAPTSN